MSLIHHVPLQGAKSLVRRVLAKLEEDQIDVVIARIAKKAVENWGSMSVDASFVLRVLLEYYRIEKQQNLDTLKAIFVKA